MAQKNSNVAQKNESYMCSAQYSEGALSVQPIAALAPHWISVCNDTEFQERNLFNKLFQEKKLQIPVKQWIININSHFWQ
jgi:phosphatidylserine decarboxylase